MVNEDLAKEIKTKCGFHNVLCMDRTMTIVAGFSATGIPICEEWSVDPATDRSFEYRNVRYADWLCSNIRVNTPFTAEHLFVKGAEPYQITEEINRKNARDLMRVCERINNNLVLTYPLAVKKAQEGKIPSVAQKKIGSGAWTSAFPQGETKDQDDDDRKNDDRKKKVRFSSTHYNRPEMVISAVGEGLDVTAVGVRIHRMRTPAEVDPTDLHIEIDDAWQGLVDGAGERPEGVPVRVAEQAPGPPRLDADRPAQNDDPENNEPENDEWALPPSIRQ